MNRIIFLGTGGARIVVMKQIRWSGGMWFEVDGTNFLLDPGPGALIRCLENNLNPKDLDGIILSHRHLDHSADINVMIEAMTEGGYAKKGVVFAPKDALEEDPVIFRYLRGYVDRVEELFEKKRYQIGKVSFVAPIPHVHGKVETYGINFKTSCGMISYLADTRYFPDLHRFYRGDLLIINVVRFKPRAGLDHLSIDDVRKVISKSKPKVTILTHFGMTMLKANPWKLAAELAKAIDRQVVVARDGMVFDLDRMKVAPKEKEKPTK